MKWLTDNSRLEKSPKPHKWYLVDNELFQDKDGAIYLVPRNFETDNYTICDILAPVAGNKSKWAVRPSHLHDFGCEYHKLIKVKLSEKELRVRRLLRVCRDKLICEDIPTRYLELIPVTKWELDCMFKRAMKATGTIPARVYNLYRCGVFFNVGWLKKPPVYDFSMIYKRAGVNENSLEVHPQARK